MELVGLDQERPYVGETRSSEDAAQTLLWDSQDISGSWGPVPHTSVLRIEKCVGPIPPTYAQFTFAVRPVHIWSPRFEA